MRKNIEHWAFDSAEGQEKLTKQFPVTHPDSSSSRIISLLKEHQTKYIVVEVEYIDRDFSSDYKAFYAQTFKRYGKVCRRYHFFSVNVAEILNLADVGERAKKLEEIGKSSYVGFVVARPLRHAPIGRAMLGMPPNRGGDEINLHVRATAEVHLLGAKLNVVGAPFAEQDSRVGACAQITMWVCGRLSHLKHRGAWFSVADITSAAINPTDHTLSRSLPAGSDGLTLDNIARGLRGMGYQPLYYMCSNSNELGQAQPKWPASLRPQDIIARYVESGIPVIVGLVGLGTDGHAVTVVGSSSFIPQAPVSDAPISQGSFTKCFIVNDDQTGCYLSMPIAHNGTATPAPDVTKYSVDANVFFICIPLPAKVFVKGEIAESAAADIVHAFQENWPNLTHYDKLPESKKLAEDFVQEIRKGRAVLRTTLMLGSKYKEFIASSQMANPVKNIIVDMNLPRFVWMCEMTSFDLFNHAKPSDRRIVGHILIDATAGNLRQFPNAVLIAHFPGLLIVRDVNAESTPDGFFDYKYGIEQDPMYESYVRS